MSDEQPQALSQAHRDRLAFIDLRLRFLGEITRLDLISRFGIQAAAATRDLTLYRQLAPGNLRYNPRSKAYEASDPFRPVFDFPPHQVLSWLLSASNSAEPETRVSALRSDRASLPIRVDLQVLSVVTRAIHRGAPVEISYRSLSSGLTVRQVVPFALVDTGLNYHLRAFDRRHNEFRDFVLSRLDDARTPAGAAAASHEQLDHDIQWNRVVELELVPHPANVQHPDAVEAEHDMRGGVLIVRTRAAIAGYLLRRWQVDCTEDHSLKGREYRLWLRNRAALYGVENMVLAPGYVDGEQEHL